VFLAEVADVRAGGFEDPQAQQPEHGHQREVVPVGGLAGGGEQRLELQVRESEGRRLGRHGRTAHILGWRVVQDAVDDAGPVEPGGDRKAPGNRRGPEQADLLHPPDIQLQMRAPGQEGIQAAFGTPGEIAAQVGVGVFSGGALETGEISGHGEPQPISMRNEAAGLGGDKLVVMHHASTLRPLATPASPQAPSAANECAPLGVAAMAEKGHGSDLGSGAWPGASLVYKRLHYRAWNEVRGPGNPAAGRIRRLLSVLLAGSRGSRHLDAISRRGSRSCSGGLD
jgi:hypothetical protein